MPGIKGRATQTIGHPTLFGSTRHHLGLLGRILAILLLTVVIEFGASTVLYERAARLSLREDEARRLAEHLVIARKLIDERSWAERPEMASELTTDRYDVQWGSSPLVPPPLSAELRAMRRQIIAWEPELAKSELRLKLVSPGRKATVMGGLRLADGSWVHFTAKGLVHSWDLALGRMLLALVPAAALLILGALLIRRALSPLRRLAQATERIGLGEEVIVRETGTFEVRDVIRAFNEMQLRIHRLMDERMEALAAVGHDIRTPLARLRLRLDAVPVTHVREAILTDVSEMDAMIGSLLAFLGGEKDPEEPVLTDLAVLAATVAEEYADLGNDSDYVGPDHLSRRIRPHNLRRAIGNLVENALRYGSRATVSVVAGENEVLIRVDDDGPGIAEDKLDDVLRPFTRLDTARQRNTQGLGLGLAIVVRAVNLEKGKLTLSNRLEGGLRAEIALPDAQQ